MDDNNAQLHLTHAQFAPVKKKPDSKDKGVTKASRKKTHITTNWWELDWWQFLKGNNQILKLREWDLYFSLGAWLTAQDAGETSFKDEDHRKKVLDNQIIMCLLTNALLKEHLRVLNLGRRMIFKSKFQYTRRAGEQKVRKMAKAKWILTVKIHVHYAWSAGFQKTA